MPRGELPEPDPGGQLFVNPDGTLDRTAYLELMAQTFAALKGWRDRQHGQSPQVGYLVGATGVECFGTARIGDKLTTTIQETGTFGAFKILEGHVYRPGSASGRRPTEALAEAPHSLADTINRAPVKETSHPRYL